MIANLLILAFLAFMVFWWGSVQGAFSAFLHLLCTILAGAMAFALWEPFAMWLLATETAATAVAWGLSLLALFVIFLSAFRKAADRLCRENMQFHQLVNLGVGGLLGLFSGILSAGVTVIALGFMPLGVDLGGYQPFALGDDRGEYVEGPTSLWIPVDGIAGGLFTTLSGGSLSSGSPMALYVPGVSKQAGAFRLRGVENQSVVATPGSVTVGTYFLGDRLPVVDADEKAIERVSVDDYYGMAGADRDAQYAVVDTRWTKGPATYETDPGEDKKLYLPHTQVSLVTWREQASGHRVASLYRPVAVGRGSGFEEGKPTKYEVQLLDDTRTWAEGVDDGEHFSWIFRIPEDEQPKFLIVRRLRIPLPEEAEDGLDVAMTMKPEEVADGVGEGENGKSSSDAGQREGPKAGVAADFAEVNNRLPRFISKNVATMLRYNDGGVESGRATVSRLKSKPGGEARVEHVWAPEHMAVVRIRMTDDSAGSLLGAARASAAALNQVFIRDDKGKDHSPIGYVLFEKNEDQRLNFMRLAGAGMTAKELPTSGLDDGDVLYLYFEVPKDGRKIVAFHIGATTRQELDLTVPGQ